MSNPISSTSNALNLDMTILLKQRVGEHDWPGWADMFTDDARYEEHFLGVFEGKPAIEKFIVDVMKEYSAMTLWIEWSIIDDDRIGF